MQHFVWKEEYSVNINLIDKQHQKLIKIMNELYDAILTLKAKEKINDIFKQLFDYANYHFSTEEKYFEKFNFKYKKSHIRKHNFFKKKLSSLYKKMNENELELSFKLLDFLEDWLIEHLNTEDKKYIQCFKEHGLK
ncbi:MAG: bacteriohemerythrin [Candidatus Woesearchaeota archaeon]